MMAIASSSRSRSGGHGVMHAAGRCTSPAARAASSPASRNSPYGSSLRQISPVESFSSLMRRNQQQFFQMTEVASSSISRSSSHGAIPAAMSRNSPFRQISPAQSVSSSLQQNQEQLRKNQAPAPPIAPRRNCLCSPTTHQGSFRCSLHKNGGNSPGGKPNVAYSTSNRLNARRSAMTNSLVRIVSAEGTDLIKRALAALIRPSNHQQRRRVEFQPRPSRLSVTSSVAEEESDENTAAPE